MIVPHEKISERLNVQLRKSQCFQAYKMYCQKYGVKMVDVEFLVFVEWLASGLTKLRAGCSGKKRYESRKEAKKCLKSHYVRFENDGVYECAHCQSWHVTSNLLEPQGEVFRYFLYGVELI